MIDMEKVIKALEFCTQHGSMCGSDCNGHYERYTDDGYVIKLVDEYRSKCPYGKCETGCVKTLAKDALELLKEQEPVFVGCSDCKHYGYHDMTNQDGFCYCMKRHEYLSPDFFCADWEGGGNN